MALGSPCKCPGNVTQSTQLSQKFEFENKTGTETSSGGAELIYLQHVNYKRHYFGISFSVFV